MAKLVKLPDSAWPGRLLSPTSKDVKAGPNTYSRAGVIRACTVGKPQLVDGIISVVPARVSASIPAVRDVVTCRVTSISRRMARCDILCVNNSPLTTAFKGIIRLQDVRATEKDKVQIHTSFKPTDVVLARVISLGDSRSYYLSTAENELGVVYAKSASGGTLIPISWCEMECDTTGAREPRKVAKVNVDEVQKSK